MFHGTPDEVKEGLTETTTVRCGLNDTAVSASVIGRRGVARTAGNVEQVSSVIIMLNGKDIASVAQSHTAKILVSSTNIRVSGDVSGQSGERGFLELVYQYPTSSQVGDFTCEINAVSVSGHGVVFTSAVEVGISQPTLADVVSHMQQVQSEKASLEARVKVLEAEKYERTHSETGVIECPDSSTWKGRHSKFGSTTRDIDIVQRFQTPYSRPPTVKIGVVEMDGSNKHNARYLTSVVKVDKNGFTVRCSTWVDSQIYRMGVSWISVPK